MPICTMNSTLPCRSVATITPDVCVVAHERGSGSELSVPAACFLMSDWTPEGDVPAANDCTFPSSQFDYSNSMLINTVDEDGSSLELGGEFPLEENEHFNNIPVNTQQSNVQVPTNVYNRGQLSVAMAIAGQPPRPDSAFPHQIPSS